MADTPRDPEALQRDIERTRDELARALDAIADRVNPKTLTRRRVDLFREGAQQFRERPGADGTRGMPGARGGPDHPGTTASLVRRGKVPLIVGAGVVLTVTAAVVVWRLRSRSSR